MTHMTHERAAHAHTHELNNFLTTSTLQTHIKQLVRQPCGRASCFPLSGPRADHWADRTDGAHTYTYTARAAAHPSAARPARCARPGRARAARLRPRATATPAARRRSAPALSRPRAPRKRRRRPRRGRHRRRRCPASRRPVARRPCRTGRAPRRTPGGGSPTQVTAPRRPTVSRAAVERTERTPLEAPATPKPPPAGRAHVRDSSSMP